MANMSVKDMIVLQLKLGGYDGLCNSNGECGCKIDDLMPCDCPETNCVAGHDAKCPMNGDCKCGGFHIRAGLKTA